jgi:hypothetical protein
MTYDANFTGNDIKGYLWRRTHGFYAIHLRDTDSSRTSVRYWVSYVSENGSGILLHTLENVPLTLSQAKELCVSDARTNKAR